MITQSCLGARREDGFSQFLGFFQACRQGDAADGSIFLIGFPAGAGNIPTDDAFYRNHVELLAFHALTSKFRCAEEFRHISRIYGKHMVRNNIFGELKPEFGKAGQDGPFIGDGVFQDVVESGNAIGSHHDKAVTNVVDFADFTRLKGFIFLHDTSSLYFGILIIAQATLFVE